MKLTSSEIASATLSSAVEAAGAIAISTSDDDEVENDDFRHFHMHQNRWIRKQVIQDMTTANTAYLKIENKYDRFNFQNFLFDFLGKLLTFKSL